MSRRHWVVMDVDDHGRPIGGDCAEVYDWAHPAREEAAELEARNREGVRYRVFELTPEDPAEPESYGPDEPCTCPPGADHTHDLPYGCCQPLCYCRHFPMPEASEEAPSG